MLNVWHDANIMNKIPQCHIQRQSPIKERIFKLFCKSEPHNSSDLRHPDSSLHCYKNIVIVLLYEFMFYLSMHAEKSHLHPSTVHDIYPCRNKQKWDHRSFMHPTLLIKDPSCYISVKRKERLEKKKVSLISDVKCNWG